MPRARVEHAIVLPAPVKTAQAQLEPTAESVLAMLLPAD